MAPSLKTKRLWENFEADAAKIGAPLSDYETVFLLYAGDVSYAFHIDTPDSVISEFQKAFDQLYITGMVDEVFKRYGISRH